MIPAKVVLISDSESPIRLQIRLMLAQHSQYEIIPLDKDLGLSSKLKDLDTDAIIFDAPVLGKYELVVLNELVKLKPNARLLVLADHITIFSYKEIASFKNSIALQKPLHPAMFLGLLEKAVCKDDDLTPIRSPRFIIDEAVRIVTEKTGLMVPTRMRNYSAGGAFLEYHGISLKVGDRLRMRMTKQGKMAEHLDVKAKVVWIREGDGPRSAMRGIGIQFLDV